MLVNAQNTAPAPNNDANKQVSTTTETPAVAKSEPQSAKSGGWQIQLIASKNKTAVEKAWTDLSSKYADLKKLPHEIQATDLGTQGMFYRLRAGSFANKDEASQTCALLNTKGLRDCIAKEK